MMVWGHDPGCGFGSGSKSGWPFSAGLGGTPWPSTPRVARGAFFAGLPGGHWRREFAGGSEKQRPHPLGPEDGGRQPPRE